MFHGSIYKRGKVADTAIGETREAAAAILFERNPNAKSVTTSRAYQDADGTWQGNGSDIRWIDRPGL